MKETYTLTKPITFVLSCLTDMEKFVSHHPVISRMKPLGNNQYLVYETLKLGFISWSFTYIATVECDTSSNKVTMTALVMKLNRIHMVFDLREEGGKTIVKEEVAFRSPLPVKGVMTQIFRKQHAQLFKNIEEQP